MDADPWVADLALAEVASVRRRNRARVGMLRFPLLALAVLLSCTAAWTLAVGRDSVAMFYAPGLLVVAGLSGLNARRTARARGVQVKVYPWMVTALILLVLSASVSRWGFAHGLTLVEEIGPGLVFATGILAFGIWVRNTTLTLAGSAMIATSLLSVVITTGDAAVALQMLGFAVLLTASAAVHRSGPEASP
jgi:hypothetical protein